MGNGLLSLSSGILWHPAFILREASDVPCITLIFFLFHCRHSFLISLRSVKAVQNFWKPLRCGRTTEILTENIRNYQLSLPPFYFICWLSTVVLHSKGWPDLDGTWWGDPFALSLFFKWRLHQEWPPLWVNTFSFTIIPATSPGCLSPNIQGVVLIIILRSRPPSSYVRGQRLHEGRCFMYAVAGGHSVAINCNCKVNLVAKSESINMGIQWIFL